MPLPFKVRVRGVSFRQDAVVSCHPGDPVTIAHDVTNPHDPNAVAVAVHGTHIGYLPAALAGRMVATCGQGLTGAGTVTEVGGQDTVGVEIEVSSVLAASEPAVVDAPDAASPGPASEEAPPVLVLARSGRTLGTFLRGDDTRVVVRNSDGLEVSYPAALVTVTEPAALPA